MSVLGTGIRPIPAAAQAARPAACPSGRLPAARAASRHTDGAIRTLLVDNYDSYTYNLFQVIAHVNGTLPTVVRNDEYSWEVLQQLVASGAYDNVVISPGPGTPEDPKDIGVCMPLLQQEAGLPVLGVCLGHQALALAHGGAVVPGPEPVHGRLSELEHSGHPLFCGVPSGTGQGFLAVRYHSLLVQEEQLPDCLVPICWTVGPTRALPQPTAGAPPPQHAGSAQPPPSKGLLMGLAHRTRPHYGVQFHPESVGTQYGVQLLANFRDLSAAAHGKPRPAPVPSPPGPPGRVPEPLPWPVQAPAAGALRGRRDTGRLQLAWRRLPTSLNADVMPDKLFWELHGDADGADTFWLDSSSADRGRFSFMGGAGGTLWRRITFHLPPPTPAGMPPSTEAGCVSVQHPDGSVRRERTSWFDWLDRQVQQLQLDSSCASAAAKQLPFNFWGGFIGYLGYELKAECGADNRHASPLPDAAMFFADRVLACDHHNGSIYVLALHNDRESRAAAYSWMDATEAAVASLTCAAAPARLSTSDIHTWPSPPSPTPPALSSSGSGNGASNGAALAAAPALRRAGTGGGWDAAGTGSGRRSRVPQAHSTASGSWAGGVACRGEDGKPLPAVGAAHRAGFVPGREVDAIAAAPAQQQQHGPRAASSATALLPDLAAPSRTQPQAPSPASTRPPAAEDSTHASAGRSRADATSSAAAPNGQSRGRGKFVQRHSRQQYLANIRQCQQYLRDGHSYELCLTTMLSRQAAPPPRALYTALRNINPAPYSAWLRFGQHGPALCCSSPERFLRLDRGGVLEARPIKGTVKRDRRDAKRDAALAAALAASEKDRAENLMIVDLLRNDLGRVCDVGTVHVPGLMEVETFATVHQLVSTVRGRRRADRSAVACIRAAFPGGSMTGAPKVRSMAILDELEGSARGVYSGSVGFISVNDTFDLNIVIRSAVVVPGTSPAPPTARTTRPVQPDSRSQGNGNGGWRGQLEGGSVMIGAGGAIVVQSEAEREYEEMHVKARPILHAVSQCDRSQPPAVHGACGAEGSGTQAKASAGLHAGDGEDDMEHEMLDALSL